MYSGFGQHIFYTWQDRIFFLIICVMRRLMQFLQFDRISFDLNAQKDDEGMIEIVS